MNLKHILTACLWAAALSAQAQSAFVEKSTDALCLLPTAAGSVKSLADGDHKGLMQLGITTAVTLAVNYGLEAAITKDRPDGTGRHAFPSTHTAAAFSGATFLLRRYGWQWGVPAYAAATWVAWGRVHAKRHDVWDVLGGAAIGTASALVFTRPLSQSGSLSLMPATLPGNAPGFCLVWTH